MRKCLLCSEDFNGRADKKFCGDACRNAYNNEHTVQLEKQIKPIYHLLRRNRMTLAKLMNFNGVTVSEMARNGFNFEYATHKRRREEVEETFCFDYGFRLLDAEKVEIIKENP